MIEKPDDDDAAILEEVAHALNGASLVGEYGSHFVVEKTSEKVGGGVVGAVAENVGKEADNFVSLAATSDAEDRVDCVRRVDVPLFEVVAEQLDVRRPRGLTIEGSEGGSLSGILKILRQETVEGEELVARTSAERHDSAEIFGNEKTGSVAAFEECPGFCEALKAF